MSVMSVFSYEVENPT